MLILQPTLDHQIYLIALDVTGTIHRTEAGQKGMAVVKQRQWLNLHSSFGPDQRLGYRLAVGEESADWTPDMLCALVLTNRVDYCTGNELCCRARATRLTGRFVKAWDLPTEYSLRSAQASVSLLSNLAMNLVDVKSLAAATTNLGIPELQSDKMYLMGEGWGQAVQFALNDQHGLRVFCSRNPELSAASPQQIEHDIKQADVEQLPADPSGNATPSVKVKFPTREKRYGLALWRQGMTGQHPLG